MARRNSTSRPRRRCRNRNWSARRKVVKRRADQSKASRKDAKAQRARGSSFLWLFAPWRLCVKRRTIKRSRAIHLLGGGVQADRPSVPQGLEGPFSCKLGGRTFRDLSSPSTIIVRRSRVRWFDQ